MPDKEQLIEECFNLFFVPGHCLEVRCLSARVSHQTRRIVRTDAETTVAGWFTRPDELLCELSRIEDVSAYITVNPVNLIRRPLHAKNTLKVLKRGEFCSDKDISIIRYLIIDIDPVRSIAKSNSTDKELEECLITRDKVITDLGLAEHCISGMSGNGAFILVRLPDCENNDSTIADMHNFVSFLSEKYSNEKCTIDTNSKNPSRMIGIFGTTKYRDKIATADRPHRRVELHAIGGQSYASPSSIRSSGMAESQPIRKQL